MFPFAFFTTEGLSKLKLLKWKRFKFTIHRIAILYLVLSTAILSVGFIFMTSENPFFYFNPNYLNKFQYQIPTSMLQNTISIIDCHDTVKTLQWYKDNINSNAILLTHTVFYGWALLTLNEAQIKSYGFDNPVNVTKLNAIAAPAIILITVPVIFDHHIRISIIAAGNAGIINRQICEPNINQIVMKPNVKYKRHISSSSGFLADNSLKNNIIIIFLEPIRQKYV